MWCVGAHGLFRLLNLLTQLLVPLYCSTVYRNIENEFFTRRYLRSIRFIWGALACHSRLIHGTKHRTCHAKMT
ncbi:hypothetical protein CEV34_1747 [Brucella pseudogrignonensis]|uniref:Uncharacterized protein n=1 Tax=Brucella pseudogrignonensis TaxID=419475 RepID=A0A256GJB3_9HYPH|nr:hypothetical protein CEV34_1747 [Brucella pseudogrignonensis]